MASDYGSTPLQHGLRIRAGVLLSFWQRHLDDERGADVDADTRREVIATRMLRMRRLLEEPDGPANEAAVRISEEWAWFVEAPDAEPVAPAKSFHSKTGSPAASKPGSPIAFLHGAFREFLPSCAGVELQIFHGGDHLSLTVVRGGDPGRVVNRTTSIEQLPQRARSGGRKAMQEMLKELFRGKE